MKTIQNLLALMLVLVSFSSCMNDNELKSIQITDEPIAIDPFVSKIMKGVDATATTLETGVSISTFYTTGYTSYFEDVIFIKNSTSGVWVSQGSIYWDCTTYCVNEN